MSGQDAWSFVKRWRSQLVILLTPLLLLPLPLVIDTPEGKTGFALFLMAIYWVTEAVPISVTALMPVFLFPMMGVLPADVVARSYIKDLLLLFLGGLLMAVAIERWNLHRRIALRILLLVGSEPRWLMLGLMLATWFLSMWMSNTATTAMMVPITDAVLKQLKGTFTEDDPNSAEAAIANNETPEKEKGTSSQDNHNHKTTNSNSSGPASETPSSSPATVGAEGGDDRRAERLRHYGLMCKGMLMSVCYAANSGGIATLTGTGPNLVLKKNADDVYQRYGLQSPVNFAVWMGFGFPLSLIVLLVCWLWLQIVFLRCRGLCQCCSHSQEKEEQGKRVRALIKGEYQKLGPVSFAEGSVLGLFCLLVLLWITRDLGGVGGWGNIFKHDYVSDSTPAVLIGVILFFYPSENPFRRQPRPVETYSVGHDTTVEIDRGATQGQALLKWPDAHANVPWSLFLLLGGGFALSDACKESGLSLWVGEQLKVLDSIPNVATLFLLCFLVAAMTEVTSNTAISILFLPILSDLALGTGVHPLYYMIPATLACSFAFMLPVATPPNAIVFATGQVRVLDMMATGIVMNLLSVPLLVMATVTWGDAIFNFEDVPAPFLNQSMAVANA